MLNLCYDILKYISLQKFDMFKNFIFARYTVCQLSSKRIRFAVKRDL